MDGLQLDEALAEQLYGQFCAAETEALGQARRLHWRNLHPPQWKVWMRFAARVRAAAGELGLSPEDRP